MVKQVEIYECSGNVFKDIGYPNPEEAHAKAALAYEINQIIKKRKLTQKEAAKLLGVDQPEISALSRGRLSGFSYERLFKFLNLLDCDVTISITHKPDLHESAQVSVVAS